MASLNANVEIPDFCIHWNNVARTKMLFRIWELSQGRSLKVLDVGCGIGHMWEPFLEKANNVRLFAFDPNPQSVSKAQDCLGKFDSTVKRGNIRNIGRLFPEHPKFDIVVSHSVLEHVYPRDRFISGIAQVLKPKGTLILCWASDHFRLGLRNDLRNIVSQWLAKIGVEKYFAKPVDESKVIGQLQKQRFEIIEHGYHVYAPLKMLSKRIDTLENKMSFLMLWSEVEKSLNQTIRNKEELHAAMGETYIEARLETPPA